MNLTNWIQPQKEEKALEAGGSMKRDCVDTFPWAEKYRPRTLKEFVGNQTAVNALKRWAESWCGTTAASRPKTRAVLLYGNVGTGKTCLSYALANDYDWEVVEMNASDSRTKEVVEKIAGVGSQTRSLSGRTKLILVEEIEGMSGVKERGASQVLTEAIRDARSPIIITTNDIKNKNAEIVGRVCEKIPLKKATTTEVAARMADILRAEGFEINESVAKNLRRIADGADGDIRSALNDLQVLAHGGALDGEVVMQQRDRPIDIHKALQKIFKSTDYATCRKVIWDLDQEPSDVLLWLDENIPIEYSDICEKGSAYENISLADVFLGRVTNRQYWGFLRYANDLMTAGVCFAKKKPHYEIVQYKFPSLIWKRGAAKGRAAAEEALASRISPILHASKKELKRDYLPLLKKVFNKDPEAGAMMIARFELSADETAYFE